MPLLGANPLTAALALAFAAGALLGLFGGGGSLLTLPILLYVLGMDEQTAIATSLVVVGFTSAFALIPHARRGDVDLRTGLLFAGTGALGAYSGGYAASQIPPRVLLMGFVLTLLVAGALMVRPPRTVVETARPTSLLKISAAGLGAGLLTGLVGAGGGFILVPALTLLAGMDMRKAVGTSLFVITFNCLIAFVGHASFVHLAPGLTTAITVAAVAGALRGSRLSRQVAPAQLKRGFGLFVMATGLYVGARQL